MQVLYGMGDKLATLVEKGYRVRVYCPLRGLLPGMAYLIRRLLENTASSFLRQSLEERPVEELLASCRRKGGQGRGGEGENTSSFYNAADTDYADMDEIKHSQQAFQSVRQQLGKTICGGVPS